MSSARSVRSLLNDRNGRDRWDRHSWWDRDRDFIRRGRNWDNVDINVYEDTTPDIIYTGAANPNVFLGANYWIIYLIIFFVILVIIVALISAVARR